MNNKITIDSQDNYNVWSNAEKGISRSHLPHLNQCTYLTVTYQHQLV